MNTTDYWSIMETTGFADGDLFESVDQVDQYFTTENMESMFGPDNRPIPQSVLSEMAVSVLDCKWHLAYSIGGKPPSEQSKDWFRQLAREELWEMFENRIFGDHEIMEAIEGFMEDEPPYLDNETGDVSIWDAVEYLRGTLQEIL